MSTVNYDVVVAGAGIVGAACARALAREGLRVLVVDPQAAGGGATGAGMGHIVVMDDSEAQFALTRYSQQLWQELAPSLPASVEYSPCGTLWVAADDEEMAAVRRKAEYFEQRGVPAEIVDPRTLAELEPNLRSGLAGGLRVPGDAVLYPPCAAAHFLREALANGAEVQLGAGLHEAGSREVRLTNGDRVSCACWVNATGTSAGRLCTGLPLRPRKGHLLITQRYPGFVRHQLVELGYLKSAHGNQAESVAFNVQPRPTGQLLLGSSRQFGQESTQVESDILARMIRRAVEFMPGLARVSAIRAWTGFRAATPDSLPLIGRWPVMPAMHLATGHEGLGITTSLGTAELLVADILGRSAPIPAAPYAPVRFQPMAQPAILPEGGCL